MPPCAIIFGTALIAVSVSAKRASSAARFFISGWRRRMIFVT